MVDQDKKTVKCPQCKAEIAHDVPALGEAGVCKKCGCRFIRFNEEETTKNSKSTDSDVLYKVIKCPHCAGYIRIKIPVKMKVDLGEIAKAPAERCSKCKGSGYVKEPGPGDGFDVQCSECNGLGVTVKKVIEKKK